MKIFIKSNLLSKCVILYRLENTRNTTRKGTLTKNNAGGTREPNTKFYYRATVTKPP